MAGNVEYTQQLNVVYITSISGHIFAIMDGMRSTKTNAGSPSKNKVCIALGKSLKAHRIEKDKSQEVLGFEAAVDRTYISQIERGVGNPSVLTLAHLCHALGITLADLFTPVTTSLAPDENARRANHSKATLKPPKSRLR